MKIIIQDYVPVTGKMRRSCCKTQLLVEIFSWSDSREALLEPEENEYASLISARNAIDQAIRSMKKDCLYGTQIRDEGDGEKLYIIRKL